MTISAAPEALTQENFNRLLNALKETEEQVQQMREYYKRIIDEVYEVAGFLPGRDWTEVLSRIKTAVGVLQSDQPTSEKLRLERLNYEAARDAAELWRKRSLAHQDVSRQLEQLAKQRDPALICYSGEDILAIVSTLNRNPDA